MQTDRDVQKALLGAVLAQIPTVYGCATVRGTNNQKQLREPYRLSSFLSSDSERT